MRDSHPFLHEPGSLTTRYIRRFVAFVAFADQNWEGHRCEVPGCLGHDYLGGMTTPPLPFSKQPKCRNDQAFPEGGNSHLLLKRLTVLAPGPRGNLPSNP